MAIIYYNQNNNDNNKHVSYIMNWKNASSKIDAAYLFHVKWEEAAIGI